MGVEATSSGAVESLLEQLPESLAGTGEAMVVLAVLDVVQPSCCVLCGQGAEELAPLLVGANRRIETLTCAPERLGELPLDKGAALLVLDATTNAKRVDDHLEAALESDAFAHATILIVNASTPVARERLERMRIGGYPHVAFADLDAVPGRVTDDDRVTGGLGLICLAGAAPHDRVLRSSRKTFDSLVAAAVAARPEAPEATGDRTEVLEQALARTKRDLARALDDLENTQYWLETLKRSASWRLTAPLRSVLAAVRRLLRRG